MKNQPRYIIQFSCILAVLLAVMLQSFTKVVKMEPLSGFDKEEGEPVAFNFKNYYDGSYQAYMTEHAKRNTGFREFFIRNYNQVAYSCFNKITNYHVVEGYDHELFLRSYLNEASGQIFHENFSSIEEAQTTARKNVEETVQLMNAMKQHGTDFLFIFAPSKPLIYPEKMPQEYQNHIFDFVLETYYVQLFEEYGIPYIDFLSYFKSLKNDFPYPLYTRYGTHWAESVIPFVADSILKKLESITGYDLPSIRYVDDNLTTDYSVQDAELEGQMNLLFPLKRPALPRPIYVLDDTIGKDRPKLLAIADSYFYQLRASCFVDAFERWDYWVYNREVQSSHPGYHGKQLKWVFDAANVLEDADIVMAVFTTPFLYNYMCNFTYTAMKLYQEGTTNDEDAIQAIIDNILNTPEWLEAIEKQAEEMGLSLEDNIRRNAEYVLNTYKQDREL